MKKPAAEIEALKAKHEAEKAAEAADNEITTPTYLYRAALASEQKGNKKEAYEHLKKAVALGLPDKDSEASAYLQMCSICGERRDFRGMKHYYMKAKACKAKNEMIVNQLKEMDKYISRIPG